jgi:hypothetical protein
MFKMSTLDTKIIFVVLCLLLTLLRLFQNRNAAFGTYKDELLRQLRELAKSEPRVDDDGQDVVKPMKEFLPVVTTQNRLEGKSLGFEHKLEQNVYSPYEV